MSDTNLKLDDVKWAIGENIDGIFTQKQQMISDEFLTRNRDDRFESNTRAGEYHRFASVPVVVVEKWLNEGFDVYKEPAKAIIKRLKAENLEAFLTSNKSL
jgi:hypothetical protein